MAGARQEGHLAGGETHEYEVSLDAGAFLHAVVVPHDFDVAVSLLGPDGREIVVSNVITLEDVAESLMAIAATTGPHRVKVTSTNARAPAAAYVFTVEALRPSVPDDGRRVAAMRQLEAGVRAIWLDQAGQALTDAESQRRGLEQLETALEAFRESDDARGEALVLIEMVRANIRRGRPEALEQARRAVMLYRDLDEPAGCARALRVLGNAHAFRGNMEAALAAYADSLSLSQAGGQRVAETYARNAMGIAYDKTGRAEQAVVELQQVVALARPLALADTEMFAYNNLGIATKNLGEYRLALGYYERALELARERRESIVEANTLNNLGVLYRILGDHRRALVIHTEALALARQRGSAEHEARALNTLGLTHYRLGDFREALEYHDASLAIRRRLNDLPGQASTLDGTGRAWHRLGDSELALAKLREALRLRRGIGDSNGECATLMHLAEVERDRGDLTAALEDIEASVRLTDSLRARIADPDLRASFVAAEQERYELYTDVLMQLDREQPQAGFVERALEASERGRARVLLESLLEGRVDIRQGVDGDLLDREKELQRRLAGASARLSQALARSAPASETQAARAAIETLVAEDLDLQARIRKASPAYATLTQPQASTAREIQSELLDSDTLLVELSLGERRSWLWTASPTRVDAFELPPRRELEASARELYELLTARQPRTASVSSGAPTRIAEVDSKLAMRLGDVGRTLFGAAAARLGAGWRGKRLLIVSADALEYVPFAALEDPALPGRPLVAEHEIVKLPSASVLATIRREMAGRQPAPKTLAVLADPVFDVGDPRVTRSKGQADGPSASAQPLGASRAVEAAGESWGRRLSRLPFSRAEANSISALVAPADRLEATDFEANRSTVTSGALESYRFVHFATHGILDSEQPQLSGLVLSLVEPSGATQDGFLRLGDIYNLRLCADLVVLSACQTALGREVHGEGLVGLTRGFMYAGARRVLASLWQVDDESTAELMKRFYRAMLKEGRRPADALRTAQLELSRQPRWKAPFYWAGFVLQGEWR